MTNNDNLAPKSRYVKSVRLTYSDCQKNRIDEKINAVASIITQNGGKIVSYTDEVVGVGLATVYWVFVIIYEATEPIPDSAFGKKEKR